MADFVISAAIPKFEGASLRDLDHDDLAFLARVYRWRPDLGRVLDDELRRRARVAVRRRGRRRRRPGASR